MIILNDVELSLASKICHGGVLVQAAELGVEAGAELLENWWRGTFGNGSEPDHCVGD